MRMAPGNFRTRGPAYPGPRYGVPGPRYGYPGQPSGIRAGANRGGRDDHRRPYTAAVIFANPYVYGPWLWPGYPTVLDYGDDYGDESQDAMSGQDYGPMYYDNGEYDYGADGGYDTQPAQQWPALGPYAPGSAQSQPAADSETAVTLIFKDGRRPLKIHNYALTQSTLFVGDSRGITIPLDELDLEATEKANSDAGVDFHLPQSLN